MSKELIPRKIHHAPAGVTSSYHQLIDFGMPYAHFFSSCPCSPRYTPSIKKKKKKQSAHHPHLPPASLAVADTTTIAPLLDLGGREEGSRTAASG
jgi:hypothetical protein